MSEKIMENNKFKEELPKELPIEFIAMKKTLGDERYDVLNIITGTLLSDAVVFMNKLGVLDEFRKDKNQISNEVINGILRHRSELENEPKE